MSTTRYFDLSGRERLALTSEQFQDAVRVEGIHRGIKPPLTITEALSQTGWKGYQIPREAVTVFELVHSCSYGLEASGVAYLNAERAKAACEGAIEITNEGYGATAKRVIREAEFTTREVSITLLEPRQFNATVKEYCEANADFEKLIEECRKDWSAVLQADYDRKINQTKRAEYLRLAGGSEEIARAFWAKTEGGEFPAPPSPEEGEVVK